MLTGPTRSLADEWEYISIYDEAVDQDDPDLAEKYRLYQDGKAETPPLRDGVEPTVFYMKQLSRACFNRVRSLEGQGKQVEAREVAARGSVTDIKGDVMGGEVRVVRNIEDGIELANRASIEKIPWLVVDELGAVAASRYVLSGK